MQKGRTTLILLTVLIVLFAVIYFFDVKGGEKREKKTKQGNQLFQAEKDSVTRLILTTADNHIVCEKKGAEWIITSPVRTQGDAQTIESSLSGILSASIERKIADSTSDLSAYGLSEPRGQVQITAAGGSHVTLMIGDDNPTGDVIFVKHPVSPAVYTTAKSLWNNVNKKLYDLRDKKLMHFLTDDVRRISINSRSKGKVSLEKMNGNWQIVSPASLRANDSEVKSFLNRMANGKVKNFIAEEPSDLKKFGLEKPDIAIQLEIGESLARTSFIIGDTAKNDNGGFYAKEETRQPVFTIEKWALDGLNKNAFDFQDKKVLGYDGKSADRIVWRIASQEYAAIRVDSLNWMIMAPETLQTDQSAMSRWLNALRDFSVDELESYQPKPLNKYGLEKPYLHLSIYNGNEMIGTILVGDKTGEKYYTRTGQAPYIYRIKKNNFERLYKTPEDLAAKKPAGSSD